MFKFITYIYIDIMQSGGTSWGVPTGRRDGLVSQASDTANLPAFNDPISVQIRKFADKGLNTQDLVTLVGKKNLKMKKIFAKHYLTAHNTTPLIKKN